MFCLTEDIARIIYEQNVEMNRRALEARIIKHDKLLNKHVSFFVDPDFKKGDLEMKRIDKVKNIRTKS